MSAVRAVYILSHSFSFFLFFISFQSPAGAAAAAQLPSFLL
jgi:hypothetical protein